MKFSEKLIELRKKEGLSQEELGYKLNVTRQTVSKWELGQTTPEMEKLVEMSRIFNVSVDELINESETTTNQDSVIQDQPIVDEKPKNNKLVIIIVIALILIIVAIIGKIFTAFSTWNTFNKGANEQANGFFDKIFSLFDKAIDSQLEDLDETDKETENIKENIQNVFGEVTNKINADTFNNVLELYNGSNTGRQLKNLLEEVITSNKKENRKITVKYLEIETQDTTEIKNLKMELNESDDFEVSFEYDKDGYIYEVTIEKYENNEEDDEVFNQVNQFINDKMNQLNYYY